MNFWLKNAYSLHKNLVIPVCFQSIANAREEYPEWFAGGRTTLIPKPGPFTSENQRPMTCLNTSFERGLPQRDALCPRLFTLCLNPLAWKLAATEGYKMLKPINAKITDVL